MAQNPPSWGLVATVRAPPDEIVKFCAYHLRGGASRVCIYLDDPLIQLPDCVTCDTRITLTRCNAGYWAKFGKPRPTKHQARQSRNANHAYYRANDVDWLIHMDVDEFLVGAHVAEALSHLAPTTQCARVRSLEAMCPLDGGAPTLFKRPVRKGPTYNDTMSKLYPVWGDRVRGGFLSHVVGKLFVRTGQRHVRLKIHNMLVDDVENPGLAPLESVELAHLHAPSWAAFKSAYGFRLAHGSYRDSLAPNRPRELGGITLYELFSAAQEDADPDALHSIYSELCMARPGLVHMLDELGLLVRADLQRKDAVAQEFPAMFDPSSLAC